MKKDKKPSVNINDVFVDFRSNATIGDPLAPLRMVIRMGGHSMYIGVPNNGAEINKKDAKVLIPLLQQFIENGKFK